MEGSMIGGPALTAPEAGMLHMDQSLHHAGTLHQHPQQTFCHHLQGMAPLSSTQNLNVNHEHEASLGFDPKYAPKEAVAVNKGKTSCTSDEDEPSFTEDGDGRKKSSLWQRVKWTDAMVKLLIHVVIVMGEDGTLDNRAADAMVDANKRKAGLLQKKGKWKSVSQVMNEKGCYVSPQQCEDKFNDLNKRYKRLNDILGRGTACSVVEDPSLLDTMNNLSHKAKDDVRKILSSKQLFYREICAYHSGCKSLGPAADFEFQQLVHSSTLLDTGRHQSNMESSDEDDGDDDGEDDNDGLDDDHEVDGDIGNRVDSLNSSFGPLFGMPKKSMGTIDPLSEPILGYTKAILSEPSTMDQWLMSQDATKLTPNQQHLHVARLIQLEEQKVQLLADAVALRKQQFKWERQNCKRWRDSERQRLESKRMKLENERLSLQVKQKELDVECKRSEATMSSIDMILRQFHPKDSSNYGQAMG